MNQILFFDEKGLGSSMNKTVKFFAISMMAFGIILMGEGGYSFAKNRNEMKSQITTVKQAENLKPTITYEQNNSKLNIKIEGQSEISSVIYRWNDEADKSLLNVSGQKSVESEIDIPSGTNDLYLKVIYGNGNGFSYEQTKTFVMNTGKIDLSLQGTNIKITVNDTKGIDYISYKWNSDGEEKIVEAEESDNTKMEVTTQIPFGLNTLNVTSVNVLGVKSEKTLEVKGVIKPAINVQLLDNSIFVIDVSCSENIEEISFSVNGNDYILDIAKKLEQDFTIDTLNSISGLKLETNESNEITHVKYEFPVSSETIDYTVKAKSTNATENVSGSLPTPTE